MRPRSDIGRWLASSRWTPLLALIGVNVAVSVTVWIVGTGNTPWMRCWEMPSSWEAFFARPWTLASYMVAQIGPWDLVFNMLWLACFGAVFCTHSRGRRLLWAYAAGGIAAALFFAFAFGIWLSPDVTQYLIGSSGAVLGVTVAAGILHPRERMYVLGVWPMRLCWLVVAAVALFFLSGSASLGGETAHLGGCIGGAVCALLLRQRAASEPSEMSGSSEMSDAKLLDQLLDKVRTSGYQSLSRRERQRLTDISHRLR